MLQNNIKYHNLMLSIKNNTYVSFLTQEPRFYITVIPLSVSDCGEEFSDLNIRRKLCFRYSKLNIYLPMHLPIVSLNINPSQQPPLFLKIKKNILYF